MAAFPRLLLRARVSIGPSSQALNQCNRAMQSEVLTPSSRLLISRSKRRIIPRLPLDSSCLVSMQPLHNAIASARLKSVLAAESQSWGLVPQGMSMPL
ncbi:uncharacterized protein LOC120251194 [Dioscorea cayenensis subsp. rotundata]|uniref:Uncharacterized protein LOC120251194 n=1 Tax=Dioscorea cayennensis subsp. rotundata TaxID=55577 RepID=A0AB40AKY2_DIOCR|nr:uncharacterized protein LOC120251194 [Dioscorea cayenensis subsp. rotundata]